MHTGVLSRISANKKIKTFLTTHKRALAFTNLGRENHNLVIFLWDERKVAERRTLPLTDHIQSVIKVPLPSLMPQL